MNVLMIGDVVAQIGCSFLRQKLYALKKQWQADVVIANGENSAVGNGILPHSATFLLDSGVNLITTGNHVFRRREIYSYLDENPVVLRPANYPDSCPGKGYIVYDLGKYQLLLINLMGLSYLEPLANPFDVADILLKEHPARFILVDFHAEATGEKKALGYYLDGRVSAVVGTHTHVQTADAQILPGGSGYITDLGMTGPIHSVLGVRPDCVIRRHRTALPTRFEVPEEGSCQMDGVFLRLDDQTGRCLEIEAFQVR